MQSQGALGSITMNKASGGDGIPVELFQILKDEAVKVLHKICQLDRKSTRLNSSHTDSSRMPSSAWNKASGGDGILIELFQILKDEAVKVLHSICQLIWKMQQRPQDWKRSVFIPIPKKCNAKEHSNYCTIALISHTSKIMLKILQTRL